MSGHRLILSLVIALAAFAVACSPSPEPSSLPLRPQSTAKLPAATGAAPSTIADVAPSPSSVSSASPSASAPSAVSSATVLATVEPPTTSPPEPLPSDVRKTARWPYFAWDEARAYTFHLKGYGPPPPGEKERLHVYDADGWNTPLFHEKKLSAPLMKQAFSLVLATRGKALVSKCPFPRHGVVFFANGHPVGSVSICFTCGDILVWPDYRGTTRGLSVSQSAYEKTYRQWKTFFAKDLDITTEWKLLASQAGVPSAELEHAH